jgi:hypothetical protein
MMRMMGRVLGWMVGGAVMMIAMYMLVQWMVFQGAFKL